MRLNPDCIRDILLETETGSFRIMSSLRHKETPFSDYEFLNKYSFDEVSYHLNQCELMNFVKLSKALGYTDVIDLNPEGHFFLADIRDSNIWNKTKSTASELGLSSLNALKDISVNVVSALITNYFVK
jgi:hypothetical protein